MALKYLIQPMNFVLVKNAIASLIANERDNQILLAQQAGKTEDEIANDFDFTVYNSLWRPLDVKGMSAVAVYFDNSSFPTNRQYGDENWSEANFNIDCFAVGQNGINEFGEVSITAEQAADNRLNYLISQIYKIVCAERYWDKNSNGIVKNPFIVSVNRIIELGMENEESVVLGARITLRLEFNEPTEQIEGVELKNLIFNLKIRDEFISEFVSIIKEGG